MFICFLINLCLPHCYPPPPLLSCWQLEQTAFPSNTVSFQAGAGNSCLATARSCGDIYLVTQEIKPTLYLLRGPLGYCLRSRGIQLSISAWFFIFFFLVCLHSDLPSSCYSWQNWLFQPWGKVCGFEVSGSQMRVFQIPNTSAHSFPWACSVAIFSVVICFPSSIPTFRFRQWIISCGDFLQPGYQGHRKGEIVPALRDLQSGAQCHTQGALEKKQENRCENNNNTFHLYSGALSYTLLSTVQTAYVTWKMWNGRVAWSQTSISQRHPSQSGLDSLRGHFV